MTPCEDLFRELATSDPDRLVWMLEKELSVADISIAAEVAGSHLPGEKVVPVLIRLLQHQRAVVREGALLGLSYHLHRGDAMGAMRKVLMTDPSQVIREVADELLQMHDDE